MKTDLYFEEYSRDYTGYGGRTFSRQKELPALPVPGLEQSCNTFVALMAPLLGEEDIKETEKAVKKFAAAGDDGEKLQRALIDWAERKDILNWLEPFWISGYLENRNPVEINSNIFYMFDPHPKMDNDGTSRAAEIICAALLFKERLDSGNIEVAMEKDTPLCMSQFQKMFSATRIPFREKDAFRYPGSVTNPSPLRAQHIVVARRGHFYKLNVMYEGKYVINRKYIEDALERIISMSEELIPDTGSAGILTALERDRWADMRQELVEFSGQNKKDLEDIEDALFVVCLDDTEPADRDEAASVMLHGKGRDRWFDKVLQFIVCRDGTAAINMEHSSVDGSSIATLTGFIAAFSESPEEVQVPEDLHPDISELIFDISDDMEDVLRESCIWFDGFASETSLKVLDFTAYGKERIKSFGISPDGYVQMAMQLAFFKLLGKPCNTYEPVSMRHFLHGRTEAVRSVTPESLRFCHVMVSASESDEVKVKALKEAASAHVSRVREVRKGKGVDRHLLGLKKMYELYGEELHIEREPEIFSSPGYRTLCSNRLSTSTSSYSGLSLCGFGPVVEDGFGIRYLTRPEELNFCISCRTLRKKEHELFYSYLEGALIEMADLMERWQQKQS